MRGQPDPNQDPFRTLGVEPGASMAEVKRAYRLLAKAFHPDSAGEEALPRFLAIHAAYEELKTGKVVSAGPRSSRPAPAPAAEAWRADPSRAKAARERARTGRSRSAGGAGASASASTATGTGAGTRGRGSGTGASSSGVPPRGTSAGGTRSGRRRDARKATMGSTSYDEARDPSDATWSGASWYGPSSGEYWIVNPREYADPRKHGPDYQQRARRPLDGEQPEAVGVRFASDGATAADEGTGRAEARTARRATSSPGARATTWAATGGDPGLHADPSRPRPGEAPPGLDRVEAIGAASRAWLGGPADDPIRRLGLALVAWPPIGLAAAAAIGEATGCASYAASCGGSEPLLPWLAQAAILGLLLLLPPVARLLAGGAIAVLLALVPITAVLVAVGGGAGAPQAGFALTFLLGIAWLVGIGWSARTFRHPLTAGPAR